MDELYLQDVFPELAPFAETLPEALSVTPECILEVLDLPVDDESVYAFELREGALLKFGVSADKPLDLLLCNFEDYEVWLDSVDPDAELLVLEARLGVTSVSVQFRAAQSMHVAVIVTSSASTPLQALVEASC